MGRGYVDLCNRSLIRHATECLQPHCHQPRLHLRCFLAKYFIAEMSIKVLQTMILYKYKHDVVWWSCSTSCLPPRHVPSGVGAGHFSIIWCKNICKALIRLDKLWLLKYSIDHESTEHYSSEKITSNLQWTIWAHFSHIYVVSWRPVDISFSIPLLRSFPPSGKDSLLES